MNDQDLERVRKLVSNVLKKEIGAHDVAVIHTRQLQALSFHRIADVLERAATLMVPEPGERDEPESEPEMEPFEDAVPLDLGPRPPVTDDEWVSVGGGVRMRFLYQRKEWVQVVYVSGSSMSLGSIPDAVAIEKFKLPGAVRYEKPKETEE